MRGWLLRLQLLAGALVAAQEYITHVPGLGTLRGSSNRTLWTQRTIYQFQSIPYAKSPTGPLRFKPPVPVDPWPGVVNATSFRQKCPQASTLKEMLELKTATGDVEDCLHLSVYTTQFPGKCKSLHAVMFYIHGGSFRVGSAQDFRPNFLLEKNVILVVIQYRLGPLGFLSLQNDDIAGNMGLLDQLLALQWVNKHIEHFCGNPKQVTIFGQSSGGAAVTLMLASPLANTNLFQRAIVQSGSALCDWAMDYNPEQHAKKIAALARCPNSTNEEIAQCLRSLTPYKLLMAHYDFLIDVLMIEGQAAGGNNGGNHAVIQTAGKLKFLTQDPKLTFRRGEFLKLPMMIGVTKHEGTFVVGNIYDFILDRLNATNNTEFLANDFLGSVLKFCGIDDTTGAITDIFETKFFKPEQLGNFTKMTPGLVDICGDTLLKSCAFKTARYNSKEQDTYLYSFNYKGRLTKFGYGEDINYPFPGGVAHSDDLVYLFPYTKGNLTDSEKQVAKTMVELWTNFAIHGKPAPAWGVQKWPPLSTHYGPYVRVDWHSSIRKNFLDEYYVTINEGLSDELSSASTNSHQNYSLALIMFLSRLLH